MLDVIHCGGGCNTDGDGNGNDDGGVVMVGLMAW